MLARAPIQPTLRPANQRDTLMLDLIKAARTGDRDAIEALIVASPNRAPAAVRRLLRDRALRSAYRWLLGINPGISTTAAAKLLAKARQVLSAREHLPSMPPFDCFSVDERTELESRLRVALAFYAPLGPERLRRVLAEGE